MPSLGDEPGAVGAGTQADAAEEPSGSQEEDLQEAVDLGEVSAPEMRDRLLAQTLAHAEMKDVRYRVPYSDSRNIDRWKAGVASLLFLAALWAAFAPPQWARPEPPARIDGAQHLVDIRHALLLQAQQVDAYRVRWQRLPDALDELPGQLPGVRYVRSGNRAFQLIAYTTDGGAIIYDSSDPAPEFEGLGAGWSPEPTE